jgi:hypothetical protein
MPQIDEEGSRPLDERGRKAIIRRLHRALNPNGE